MKANSTVFSVPVDVLIHATLFAFVFIRVHLWLNAALRLRRLALSSVGKL
jgi:hypothetical protein